MEKIRTNYAIVQGHKMFLDSKDSLKLSINGIYEDFETEFNKKTIQKGDIIIDIGANIGYYTLIFARKVGSKGKVFAFEPDPTNFAILKKNVIINGYKNIVLVNKALSDKTGKLRLFLCESNKGDHRVYDSKDGRKSIDISCITLDDYFKNKNIKIDFVKMDIQGSEYGALKGMSDLLCKNKIVKIVSEFWPYGLNECGVDPVDYLKLITKHGFELYNLREKEKRVISTNTAMLLQEYLIKKENHTNIFCVKRDA